MYFICHKGNIKNHQHFRITVGLLTILDVFQKASYPLRTSIYKSIEVSQNGKYGKL